MSDQVDTEKLRQLLGDALQTPWSREPGHYEAKAGECFWSLYSHWPSQILCGEAEEAELIAEAINSLSPLLDAYDERETLRIEWDAAREKVARLERVLKGMVESYDILTKESPLASNPLARGVISGAFIGTITDARTALTETPVVPPKKSTGKECIGCVGWYHRNDCPQWVLPL